MSIVLEAQLTRFMTMADGGGRLQFDTGELTPDQFKDIGEAVKKVGIFVFYPGREGELDTEELIAIEDASKGGLKSAISSNKTQSQRLRAVLYKAWEVDDEGFSTSEQYYNHYTNRMIDHFKKKLSKEDD